MIINAKQLDPRFKLWYETFMETRFPKLIKLGKSTFPANGYTVEQDDNGNPVIKAYRGDQIKTEWLPQSVKAIYSNADNGDLKIYWDEAVLAYNPNRSGKHVLKGKIENGVYNPYGLTCDIIFDIAREEDLSLLNWWENGAMVEDQSFQNGINAEDFNELTYYFITDVEGAFKNAEKIQSLPELKIKGDLTKMRETFSGCESLLNVPNIDTSKVTSFTGAFKGCSSITDLSNIKMNSAAYTKEMFCGCENLIMLPNMNNLYQNKLDETARMFKDCKKLPEKFPHVIGIGSAANTPTSLNQMFEGTPVREVSFCNTNQGKTYLYPMFLGENIDTVTVLNKNLEVRQVIKQDAQPAICLTASNTVVYVPKNAKKMKATLVSGAYYSYVKDNGNEYIDVKNDASYIMRGQEEIASSNRDAKRKGINFSTSAADETYSGIHGGNYPDFEAKYETKPSSGYNYCAGLFAKNGDRKAWAALENTATYQEIDVVPGEALTVFVGRGGISNEFEKNNIETNKTPYSSVVYGFVMIEFIYE